MDKNVIASSLLNNDLVRAFSELVADRWDNWDLSPFLAYLVDTCAFEALPYLAEQFDVDGLRGFAMAIDQQQQRDIIKRSIALHKYIGTPWAIREACRTVGFPTIIIEEGVTSVPGGATSPEDWARFRVMVEADSRRRITASETHKIRLFVEFYKNERSHLVELGFLQTLADTLKPVSRDELSVTTLEVFPNPIILNKSGSAITVNVIASVPWFIEKHTYKWEDGSDDNITINYTGEAGNSLIEITSDLNNVGSRSITIEIKSNSGFVLGLLTIKQVVNWNAYSSAYSKAYNVDYLDDTMCILSSEADEHILTQNDYFINLNHD